MDKLKAVASPIKLKLPATSANLGPGFDALAIAMDFALHIDARQAESFSIAATGRNAAQCGDVADSLVVETYKNVLTGQGIDPTPLHMDLHNEIPLGMGCGSSAAALVAGVALASHFGGLQWSRERILFEASLLEGHPDNVAACVLGGLTVSSMVTPQDGPPVIDALSITPAVDWPLLVVMPGSSLSTKKARALLPEIYSKADAIANVQAASLVVAAFTQGRGDVLARAMRDRMHQPYREAACPLLPMLLPLAGEPGVLGAALSGAGPSVLMVLESITQIDSASKRVQSVLLDKGAAAEILVTRISGGFVTI